MFADDFFFAVAQQAFDAFVDKGEVAFVIEDVNNVRRSIDYISMQSFRFGKLLLHEYILFGQAFFF